MKLHLANALMLTGAVASMSTPAVYAAGMAQAAGTAASSESALNLTLPEIALGTTIVGGVITALTFIFRLFLRSRDATEMALTARVTALELSLTKAQASGEDLNRRMLDLLQGVVRDSAQAQNAHTAAIGNQTKVLEELVTSIETSRVQQAEEHVRILSAVSTIMASYSDDRRADRSERAEDRAERKSRP